MYVQDSFIYYITRRVIYKKKYDRFELNPIMLRKKSHFEILKCGYDCCTVHDMSADIPFEY